MPLTLDTPVATTDTIVRIEAFSVSRINIPGGPAVEVSYSLGSDPGSGYVERERGEAKLAQATVVAAMNGAPSGATVYDAVKTALYDALVTDGVIGPGTVT